MNLYTAAQMREIDRRAIQERGIPSAELMENAARALVREVRALPIPGPGFQDGPTAYITRDGHLLTQEEQAEFWALRQRSAIAFCGPGNNGGDGVAAARMLLEAGWRVRCVLVGDRAKMTDDCLEMERRLSEAGGMLEDFDPDSDDPGRYADYDVAIDALFGVGLNSALRPEAVKAVGHMGLSGWIISADVPSGIHADTGDVMGAAVKADVTVTFSRGKPGLFVGKGAVHSGRIVVADIGIPEDLYLEDDCKTMLVEQPDVHLPRRSVDGHKGDFGKLFILAGSRGYTGAAALCARAAVRGGAGLVTVAVPEDIYPIIAVKCDEAMVRPWPEDDGELVEQAKGCDAALIGPGLGQGERAERLVLRLMRELTCPVILDADGLNLISRHMDVLDERRDWSTILTPHDGEFVRLSGCELPIADRLGTARSFALQHHCILVLKGFRTIVSANAACTINPTGNSGMAKGGSGDALAGLMGALLARRGKPDEAITAVWLHGRAGDLAAEDKGEYGMTPSDLIEQIPYAMKELCERGDPGTGEAGTAQVRRTSVFAKRKP